MTQWIPDDAWDPGDPQNRDRTRALQRELRTHLLDWDPIGVAGSPEAQDEYDCLVSPLLHRLHDGESAAGIATWLSNELRERFGMRADPARESALAETLVAWWDRTTER